MPALARIEAVTGVHVATATADTGYSYAKVYGALERRGTDAIIPARAESIRTPVPIRRLRYDAKHDRVKCPRGRVLTPGRLGPKGRTFASSVKDCRNCDLAQLCLTPGRPNKVVVIVNDYPRCCAPGVGTSEGAKKTRRSTTAIAGAWRACMARPRPAMVWPGR